MNELFNGFNWTLLLDAINTQECWDSFTDKVDYELVGTELVSLYIGYWTLNNYYDYYYYYYAIEKFIPINDKHKSTSKDWVNSKVRCERNKKKNRHGQNYGKKLSLIELPVYKFGFKNNHSTVLCTAVYIETINHYMNEGSDVYSCLIDASKAFDQKSTLWGTFFYPN